MLGRDALKGHVELLVLGALTQGPTHGYGLIVRLRETSGGAFDLPEGTVYPALHRLEEAGQLASAWQEAGARRRRVYSLTPAGEQALERGREDWRAFVRSVGAIVEPGAGA
jgi:DNA-binding PadR family transcriptional regulator